MRSLRIPIYAGPFAALLILCIVLSVTQTFFLTLPNILNILTTNSPLMIIAIGMTLAMIGGGFDLSVGAILAAAGICVYFLLQAGIPAPLAVLVTILFGFLIGALANGVLIAKVKLNFFVVTLAMMTGLTGLVYVISNGQTKSLSSNLIFEIGNGNLLGVPTPVIITVVMFGASWWLLNMTQLGRNIYAVGGSPEAARLSGIRVERLTILLYGLVGAIAAIAGIVQAGLLGAASPTVGGNIALTAGAAVLLGGVSFGGGVGTVTGTIVGVLLIAVLQNGLGLFGLTSYWQDVVAGVVLIIAVALDKLHKTDRS